MCYQLKKLRFTAATLCVDHSFELGNGRGCWNKRKMVIRTAMFTSDMAEDDTEDNAEPDNLDYPIRN